MTELAKWAWLFLLSILFVGHWIFVILVAYFLIYVLVSRFKPEWLKYL